MPFRKFINETLRVDPSVLSLRGASRCTFAVAVPLALGILCRQPIGGMVMAGGAMSVGFGSFQRVSHSRIRPMIFGSIGMCLAAFIGTLASRLHFGAGFYGFFLISGVAAWFCGLLAALSPGAQWIGQQCVIAMLVASAYPGSLRSALLRAVLIFTGGLFQTLVFVSSVRLFSAKRSPVSTEPVEKPITVKEATRILFQDTSIRNPPGRYALRAGAVVMAAVALQHYCKLQNGYWVPMTALLVLKPDFYQTVIRATGRVGGTVLGAALATLLTHLIHPGLGVLAVEIALFAWFSYALQKVNYALFAVAITSYIVFLLSFAGLPSLTVLHYRSLNTLLGGALALASYALLFHLDTPAKIGSSSYETIKDPILGGPDGTRRT